MKIGIGVLVILLSATQCTNEQNSAYQFVSNLYSYYQNDTTGFSSLNSKSIDTIFSPEFLRLMRLIEKQEQAGLGYDPVCDCQDDDGFKMVKIDTKTQYGVTYADIKFYISETEYAVKLKLIKKDTKWFIADVITSRGSLYELLKKNISTHSSNESATKLVSINKDLLKGIWGTNPTENASFQILQDSIYYVDANRRLKYEISGNIFICYDENGDTNFVCFVNKLDQDSLVMKNKHTNENTGFIRFK